MAKRPAPPRDTAQLLEDELMRTGMTRAEAAAALRKKKYRRVAQGAVNTRHRGAAGADARVYRASGELCTVDDAAEVLKLHPKTVLRFIHEGRLRATRVGKAYRILRADLAEFAGLPDQGARPAEEARVTTIIDVPNISDDIARDWARVIPAALNARPTGGPPLRAEIIHEPERMVLKIVLVGSPADTVKLLTLVQVWIDQLGR